MMYPVSSLTFKGKGKDTRYCNTRANAVVQFLKWNLKNMELKSFFQKQKVLLLLKLAVRQNYGHKS